MQAENSTFTSSEPASVGRRLFEVRGSKSLTQAAFASQLGTSLRAYQNYERGESEISASVLTSLYKLFGVQPLWVLTGIDVSEFRWTDENLAIVADVVAKLESILVRTDYEMLPERKARLVVLLIQLFQSSKEVDEAKISDVLSLTA